MIIDRVDLDSFCSEKWKELAKDEIVLVESKYEESYPEILVSPIIIISQDRPPNTMYQNTKINKILNRKTRVELVHSIDNG